MEEPQDRTPRRFAVLSVRCAALGALLLLCRAVPTPADEPEPLAIPLSRSDLLLYVARAERADSVTGWLEAIQAPLAELPDWERARFQEQCASRLAEWLTRRWGEELPAADIRSFVRALEAVDRGLLYSLDEGGDPVRDASGRALLRGAQDLQQDRAAWREQAQGAMSALVERWERQAAVVWQELLALLPPDLPAALRARLSSAAEVSLARYTEEVRGEFGRLCRQAESAFLAARLRDQISPVSRSEARSASLIARGLIRDTEAQLDEARRLLSAPGAAGAPGAIGAIGAAEPGAVDLTRAADWDEQFRSELTRGIAAWDLAESRLLEERLRWEASVRGSLLEAEQAWERAFAEIDSARRGWITGMQEAYEQGRERWDQAEASLSAQYVFCAEELAAGSQRELGRLEEQVRAAVGLYRSSAELAETARSSARALQAEIRRILGRGPEEQAALAGSLAELERELDYWQGADGEGGVLAQSLSACAAAREELLALEASVRGYGEGRLPAALDGSAAVDQELARLEAEREYLRGQARIARAVLEYADNAEGVRPGASQTQAACATARRELEVRHAAYLEAARSLRTYVEGDRWDPVQYAALQSAFDAAAAGVREGRWQLQRAEEILDYASAGYSVPELDPRLVLAQREAACRRVEEVIAVLRSVAGSDTQREFTERMDGSYAALKQTEAQWLEALQHLELGRERMLLALEALEDQEAQAAEELARCVGEVFALGAPLDPDERLLAAVSSPAALLETLTEFPVQDEQALAARVGEYFAAEAAEDEEAARRMCTDAAVWLLALARGDPASALRRFGLAYYHDAVLEADLLVAGAPEVSVGILGSGSFRALVGEHFLDLGPQTQRVWNDETETWEEQVVYPSSKLTPEDYLAREARAACEQVLADPESRRLYGFFKALLAAGRLSGGADLVGAELADVAYHYVQDKARALQDHHEDLRWVLFWSPILFLANEAKIQDIAAHRAQLAQLHVEEPEARTALIGSAREAESASGQWAQGAAALRRLLGAEDPTSSSFLAVLEESSGRRAGPALAAAAAGLAEAQDRPADHFAFLAATAAAARGHLENARDQLAARVAALAGEHAQRAARYGECLQACLAADSAARAGSEAEAALQTAARALFLNPSFSLGDYREHELVTAAQMPVYTLAGQAARLEEMGGALLGLMHERLGLLRDQECQALLMEMRVARERRLAWERGIEALLGQGLREWRRVAAELEQSRRAGYGQCQQEYEASSRLWQARHLLLQANRERWLQDSAASAVKTGAAALAREMGLSLQRLSAEAQDVTIPDLTVPAVSMEEVVRRLAGGAALGQLLGRARELGATAGGLAPLLSISLPALQGTAVRSASAAALAARTGQEVQRRVALLTALQMRGSVEEARAAIAENIRRANRSVERDLTHRLQAAGYRRAGEEYSRRAIIDQTLFGGEEWERQAVPAYRWFQTPAVDAGVDLSREALEALSAEAVTARMLEARASLSRYLRLVFGRSAEERKDWDWEGIAAEFRASFEAQATAFASSAGYDRLHAEGSRAGEFMFHDTDGLFYFHIGYAPVMDEQSPEEVAQPGHGELGRIMEAYLRNEARLARGLAALEVPWYSQRFWDDDSDNDGEAEGFGAPSVRSVVDLAVTIAATATGNVWAAAAINMIDDTVFTAADLVGGYIQADQALFDLGKQALVGLATAGVGQGFDALASASGSFGEGVIGKTLLQGLESSTAAAVSGTLGAVALDGAGRLSFDEAALREALVGRAALASYVGGMTGTLLEGNTAGFSSWDAAQVRAVSGLAGGLTQAALEYAWTGQTTLNLLDFQLLGWQTTAGRTLSGGLLELELGGDGVRLSLGSGGVDVSATAVAAAVRGADTWWQNARIRSYDLLGDTAFADGYGGYRQAGTALRSLYSYGDRQAAELYQQVLAGQVRLHVGLADPSQVGRTVSEEGTKQVYLASLGERRDRYSRLLAGVALQHEAWRDGYGVGVVRPDGSVVSLAENAAETTRAVRGHTEMALRMAADCGVGLIEQERSLLRDVVALRIGELVDSGAFERYVEQAYESEEDAYSIERWSGRAIGTPLRGSGYYFMLFDDDANDAARASVRNGTWPGILLVDLIHNLFSNKDRIDMRQPLYQLVGSEDYFGALKVLYGRGAEGLETGTDVVGLIDDVITAYEIARNVQVPGGKAVGELSVTLQTIDQIIQGVGAGINAVIEARFAEYWWRSGVPNFTQKKEDLEALTQFMFAQFAAGTPDRAVFDALRQFRGQHPSFGLREYMTWEDWRLRFLTFGEQYSGLPYRVAAGMATTDGRTEFTWTFEEWAAYEEDCERIFGE